MDTLTPSWGIFNDVLPGDPWQPEPAARYNAVNELLRQQNFTAPEVPPWSRGELNCINVLNTSDQPLYFNRAVQIDSDFAGALDKVEYSNLYACGHPVKNEEGFWGIALEDIAPGQAGMVQTGGIACINHLGGEYLVPDPYHPEKIFCRNDFVAAGTDGVFHLVNRGQARVIWYDTEQERAVVMLNCRNYFYNGMFSVVSYAPGRLLVKGGVTDLPSDRYGSEVNTFEDTVINTFPLIYPTYVFLTGIKESTGGWSLTVKQSIRPDGRDLYIPGQQIVWPLARYVDTTDSGNHVRGLEQLHQGGAVNFRERYYIE